MSLMLVDMERFVVECEVTLDSTPEDAPSIPMDELIKPFSKILPNEVYLRQHGTVSFNIVKTELIDDKFLVILVQFSNGKASDPSFSHLHTGVTRIVKKNANEGIAVTAHIVIDVEPYEPSLKTQYRAVLEEVPGLTKSTIAEILTHFTKKHTKFSFLRKLENNAEIDCWPIFNIDFFASSSFEESFKKGYLCDISAIRTERLSGLDEEGTTVIKEERLVIKRKNKSVGKTALDAITKVANFAKEKGFSRLKITKSENDRVSSTYYNIPSENTSISSYEDAFDDVAKAQFASREKVQLSDPINSCQNNIHQELVNKMINILKKDIRR